MKICLAFPVLAQAQDDTSTLLSLKVHTALEAGVDHLLDAVGSRNVTQMSSLLQNLVEESISDGLGELDGDVKTALALIKAELLGDIRNSLREAHCYAQVSLHQNVMCFEECEKQKKSGRETCGKKCDGSAHKSCRDELFGLYKEHITACRALDKFVTSSLSPCPHYEKDCCYLPHTTWNCGGSCGTKIDDLQVDNKLGHWMKKQILNFNRIYDQWAGLYKKCQTSYRSYVEKDAECDCAQAECEARNCEYDSCHFLNCEVSYQKCWGACELDICKSYPKEQCLEKDRKIDWSATEKIECYVDVLMANPTKEQLLKTCGTADCINKWREEMYNECNNRCPEVDTTAKESPLDFPKWKPEVPEPTEFVVACEHGTKCAETGICHGKVKYGMGETWTEWRKSSGEVKCNNEEFGDPLFGTVKECRCMGSSTLEVETCETEGEFTGRDNACIDTIKDMIEAMGSHARRKGKWADEDVAAEGDAGTVTTKHRMPGDKDTEIRCTDHLDLDWQMPPCCSPCEERDSAPCEDGGKDDESKYMWEFYGRHNFLNTDDISDFSREKCYEDMGEHTYVYAYNLCPCSTCEERSPPPCPTCVKRKGCTGAYPEYDYKAHYPSLKANCAERDDGDRSGVGYAAAKRALEDESLEGARKMISGGDADEA